MWLKWIVMTQYQHCPWSTWIAKSCPFLGSELQGLELLPRFPHVLACLTELRMPKGWFGWFRARTQKGLCAFIEKQIVSLVMSSTETWWRKIRVISRTLQAKEYLRNLQLIPHLCGGSAAPPAYPSLSTSRSSCPSAAPDDALGLPAGGLCLAAQVRQRWALSSSAPAAVGQCVNGRVLPVQQLEWHLGGTS